MKKLILVAALSFPFAAQAQWPKSVETRLSRSYQMCMNGGDAGRGQTLAMAECQRAEIDRQDARLNQAYTMVMRRLPATRKAALRQSERNWIRQRDRQCDAAQRKFAGGTMAILEYRGCILRQTIERTLWLERYR